MADWSTLPEELLFLIAIRLFSVVELKRFRSICTSWRSSVLGNNDLFPNRPLIFLNQLRGIFPTQWCPVNSPFNAFLSRAAFFCVTLSSSSSQGWLIKSDVDINSGKFRLIDPLSGLAMRHLCERLDLLEFTISEIREAYQVLDWDTRRKTSDRFKRVILVKDKRGDQRVLGICSNGNIKYWKRSQWKVKQFAYRFSDVIVHKGLTYALDSTGTVLWVSSKLKIYRYGPPLGDNITNGCSGERSFVECGGELYIVDRLFGEIFRKRKGNANFVSVETVGFKIYKFEEELGKMIEVESLGENAFVIATDTCFSVLACEYYGCLQNSIYFKDAEEDQMKVFKLENGSITTMSQPSQSCFQMFVPSFL
ncbi:putative F-box protein At1g65770 [Capsella rubella]|uniref:putative F-box protein At1g65770 n=1 Tax=Capsella rubella TaxID=81985 RepID=UPI000CD59214|nr:putative F-box protein At1g65770 [Capsella rubella]